MIDKIRITPSCWGKPQFFTWPEIGTWYFQLVLNAQYLGKFCAYALLPVWQPKHPRTILLATSVANLTLFVSAFGAAAKFKAGPVAYVLLMFFFSMSHGYVLAVMFCCASEGLVMAEAKLVQKVLVIASTLSYTLGLFASWIWVLVQRIQ